MGKDGSASKIKVKWCVQKGYNLESHLISEGLSFSSFDIINRANKKAAQDIRKKIIALFLRDLRSGFQEEDGLDIKNVKYGVYCIGVGTGFDVDYKKRSSKIIYIGSGAVYERLRSHLSKKLFDFISEIRSVPLRFYVCDLSEFENGRRLQRVLEQLLLEKFCNEIDESFPLLNKRNACNTSPKEEAIFDKGWDRPVQKERGRNTTRWIIRPYNPEDWKGVI